MKVETERLIKVLTDDYGIPQDKLDVVEGTANDAESYDSVSIEDKYVEYHVYGGMTNDEIDNLAMLINTENNDSAKPVKEDIDNDTQLDTSLADTVPTEQIAENLEGIKVGNLYTYYPSFVDIEGHENETKLAQIAQYRPACRVKDILITSKDEDEGLIKVTFDIAENEGLELPDYAKEDYIVFESDLSKYDGPVVSETSGDKSEEIDERIHIAETEFPAEYKNLYHLAYNVTEAEMTPPDDAQNIVFDYHLDDEGDVELICKDNEYNEEWYKYIGKPQDYTALKNLYLASTKDNMISMPYELYLNILNEFFKPEDEKVDEAFDYFANDMIAPEQQSIKNTSTALLTALNSEKEAVMTYETLIKLSTDEEEIELLTKILEDEKEHVSLLSALQSKKTADSVAEDNKEKLDSYAEDVIQTPAATE